MEFDKNRVYTAVNAEELPIGSKCIFADDLNMLHKKVQQAETYTSELIGIREDCELYRFRGASDEQDEGHALVYLLKEPQYKPFSSTAKAMEVIQKHGGWIRNKEKDEICLVTGVTNSDFGIIVFLAGYYGINSTNLIHERFSFFDDGSPCGELMEE